MLLLVRSYVTLLTSNILYCVYYVLCAIQQIVRDMELVCKLGKKSTSSSSAAADSSNDTDDGDSSSNYCVSIWRPKPPDGYFSVGGELMSSLPFTISK
jgi:hypothetical protein